MKGINLTTILLIGLAVLVTLQVKSCFSNVQKSEKMIRNEVELEHLQKELPNIKAELARTREMYDSAILASNQRLGQLQNQFQKTKVIYEKIPVIIGDYDREQLRRAVADY